LDTPLSATPTYAASHPEVEELNPEDYPDINKLGILADIAPYSREYNRIRAVVDKQANGNPELRAHYEQIVDQVRQTKESTLQVDQRRFDAPVDKIEGTIKSASFHGVELSEYPGASSTSAQSAAPWPILWPIPWAARTP
jgi:hypothetical protein